jgi:hypothetical protein
LVAASQVSRMSSQATYAEATSLLHAAPDAAARRHVPVPSRSQNSGDVHPKRLSQVLPSTVEGTKQVGDPPVTGRQKLPVAQDWFGCSVEQSPPTGIGAAGARQVPGQHCCAQVGSVGWQSPLSAHSVEAMQAPPGAMVPTTTPAHAASPSSPTAASPLCVHPAEV